MVRGGVAVGAAVVGGAVVGLAVVGAAVCVAVGLGAALVGDAVRTWIVLLGEAEAEGLALGLGDAVAPARRDRPPPRRTPIRRIVSRAPATAARTRSIQRGPRRGGGMIFVVSDMRRTNRRLYAG